MPSWVIVAGPSASAAQRVSACSRKRKVEVDVEEEEQGAEGSAEEEEAEEEEEEEQEEDVVEGVVELGHKMMKPNLPPKEEADAAAIFYRRYRVVVGRATSSSNRARSKRRRRNMRRKRPRKSATRRLALRTTTPRSITFGPMGSNGCVASSAAPLRLSECGALWPPKYPLDYLVAQKKCHESLRQAAVQSRG